MLIDSSSIFSHSWGCRHTNPLSDTLHITATHRINYVPRKNIWLCKNRFRVWMINTSLQRPVLVENKVNHYKAGPEKCIFQFIVFLTFLHVFYIYFTYLNCLRSKKTLAFSLYHLCFFRHQTSSNIAA